MNRVDRLMGYLLLFQSRGLMRAQDFAEQFEISERTVYRDVQALSEVGVPIMAIPGEGYRLMEGYYLPPVTFSPEEARSLYLALAMLAGLTTPGDTQFAARSALDKIRSILPSATLRQVEALEAVIQFYALPSTTLDFDDRTFETLQKAIHETRVVHIRYHAQHNNRLTERDIEPLQLAFISGVWILTAYCRLRQAPRWFRLDRIDRLNTRSERFTPREVEINVPGSRRFRVAVRVDASIVRWVREKQHFTYTDAESHPLETGDIIMVYRPPTLDQLEGWLLSWGDKIEVLEPTELRKRMATIATNMLNRHGE